MNTKELCSLTGYSYPELTENNRTERVSTARHAVCYVLRNKYELTPREIGSEIQRDRATVIHSIKRFGELLEVRDRQAVEMFKKMVLC